MSLPSRLLGANPSIQVSTLLSGTLTTPSAKGAFAEGAYDSIATVAVGSGGQATIEFTSIPATYTHLELRYSLLSNRGTYSYDATTWRINSDTSANYTMHNLAASGAGATPQGGSDITSTYIYLDFISGTSTGNLFGNGTIVFYDYKNTNKFKTFGHFGGTDLNGSPAGAAGRLVAASGVWENASTAITTISISPFIGTAWAQHTNVSLYGVK
jgi:hypothetical protein